MLFPPLLVPPRPGRLDTLYCVFAFAACWPCACAGARAAPQQTAVRMIKRVGLILLVVSCVVIFFSFVEFHDNTLGTGLKGSPEPLRTFDTSHFALRSMV